MGTSCLNEYSSVPGVSPEPGLKSLDPLGNPLASTGRGDRRLKSTVAFTSGVS